MNAKARVGMGVVVLGMAAVLQLGLQERQAIRERLHWERETASLRRARSAVEAVSAAPPPQDSGLPGDPRSSGHGVTAGAGPAADAVDGGWAVIVEREGWPADRPFFVLPKRLLGEIRYPVLTPEGLVTPELVAILGLSAAEREALERRWAEFREGVQGVQRRKARPLPEYSVAEGGDERAVAFQLGPVAGEIEVLRERMQGRLREELGATRAGLLAKPLRERAREWVPPLPEDLEVRMVYRAHRRRDGRVVHVLRMEDVNGSQRYEMPVEFPEPDQGLTDGETYSEAGIRHPVSSTSPLWHFRHLFGTEPLLPLEPVGDSANRGSGP